MDKMEKFLLPVVAVDNIDGDEVEESEPAKKKFKRMMEKKMEEKKSPRHQNQSTTKE